MNSPLNAAALDQLFLQARTFRGSSQAWLDTPVSNAQLGQLYELMRMAPTSANCSPARIVFVRSDEARAKLRDALDAGNVDQTMAAPVTAIIGQDMEFYEHLPQLFPYADARSWFAGKPAAIEDAAFRNASLQGAYLILAARALGLDCGPMSGFDKDKMDAAFFAGTPVKSNFICSLGYGNRDTLTPRGPRLDFDQACRIA
ncbi:MAG: malonic semialdehyde reductase [Lysobacteraceae bacterium]|nr:MAG: malonic semialdehyde reductase [Xanthomonadaceae bacterium]